MLLLWGSGVECMSALARLEREAALDGNAMGLAVDRLKKLADGWHEIEPIEIVRENTMRFLRAHPLRAADAFQLAAALIPAERGPASLQILTLNDRLAVAARKEGFTLVNPGTSFSL